MPVLPKERSLKIMSVGIRTVPPNSGYGRLARTMLLRAAGFRHCSEQTIDALLSGSPLQQVPRDTLICRCGDAFDELCLIVEGTLESSVQLDASHRHLVAYTSPGDLLGMVCCVDRLPVPHDMRAHTDAILLRMPLALINQLRHTDPGISKAFEIQLAQRARQFYDRLSESLLLSFEARLSSMLLELTAQFGLERGSTTIIALRIPQTDLADLLGVSRQRVNQGLKEFERQGILRLRRSSMESIDVNKLKEIVKAGRASSVGIVSAA